MLMMYIMISSGADDDDSDGVELVSVFFLFVSSYALKYSCNTFLFFRETFLSFLRHLFN